MNLKLLPFVQLDCLLAIVTNGAMFPILSPGIRWRLAHNGPFRWVVRCSSFDRSRACPVKVRAGRGGLVSVSAPVPDPQDERREEYREVHGDTLGRAMLVK